MNLLSSNNHAGWAHYVLAHLLEHCSLSSVEAAMQRLEELSIEAMCAEGHTGNLSDIQCIMVSNKWFYYVIEPNTYLGLVQDEGDGAFAVIDHMVEWWRQQM